jgi:hypothetical protein
MDPLEDFIDESIRWSVANGYVPTLFNRLRRHFGTVAAIEQLVQSDDVQSGFKKLRDLGLLEWSIEVAVLKFPERFSKSARECSELRLRAAKHDFS